MERIQKLANLKAEQNYLHGKKKKIEDKIATNEDEIQRLSKDE